MEIATDRKLHRVAATAVIYKDGKFLLTKRSSEMAHMPGAWVVPGGGLETDDYVNDEPIAPGRHRWNNSVEKALRREIFEETGVTVGKLTYLMNYTIVRGDGIPVLVLSFAAPFESGEVVLNGESAEYRWVTYEEVQVMGIPEGVFQDIEMVHKILTITT